MNAVATQFPELPTPAAVLERTWRATLFVGESKLDHGIEQHAVYTADQMHQYARDYAAALSQTAGVPSWIVNDLGELGVMVNEVAYFLYKGDNIVYEDAKHDDGSPMLYRMVGKREFGEVCHPRHWWESGWAAAHRYTQELIYTPGLSFGKPEDGDWRPLPPQGAAPAASGVDTSTNEAWAARAQEKIATMEAASGGEDDMCPNCVTPWKCNGPHESTGGASVSERARELLAAELRSIGYPSSAAALAAGANTEDLNVLNAAIRALEQALTQQRGDGEAVDRDAWAEALELPEGYTVEEFFPGGWHYAWTRADGERMVSGTTWNHPALAAIAAWQYAPATTPQPSADAVREYDRELIARMLSCYDGGGYTDQVVAEQIRLLREAENLEVDAKTVVREVPDGMVLVPREPDISVVHAMREAYRSVRRGGIGGQTLDASFQREYAPELAAYYAMLSAASGEKGAG